MAARRNKTYKPAPGCNASARKDGRRAPSQALFHLVRMETAQDFEKTQRAGLCPGTRRFALKWTASMPKPLFRPYVRGPFRLYIDFYGSGIFRPWCRAFPGPRFLDPKAPPISRICAGALLAPKGVHQSAETYIMESKPFLAPKGIQYKLPDKWHLPPGNCIRARHRLERKRHPQESGASGHRGAVRRRGMKKRTIRRAGAYDRT